MTVAYTTSSQIRGRDVETGEYDLTEQEAELFRSMLALRGKAIQFREDHPGQGIMGHLGVNTLHNVECAIIAFIDTFAASDTSIRNDAPSWSNLVFEGMRYTASNPDGNGLTLTVEPV